jgi:UDP-2-acetamido-2,6-beta-L-arabino-hexul-4-ose reductase
MKALVTGSRGFVGSHLLHSLHRQSDVEVLLYDRSQPSSVDLADIDAVFHLAGVSGAAAEEELQLGNVQFTQRLCNELRAAGACPKVLMASSARATSDDPYGISKLRAEACLKEFSRETGAEVVIFRWVNIFGPGARPHHNSVVASFCYDIARGVPLSITDPDHVVSLAYVDNVVDGLLQESSTPYVTGIRFASLPPCRQITLRDLSAKIQSFYGLNTLPIDTDQFSRRLFDTYCLYRGDFPAPPTRVP